MIIYRIVYILPLQLNKNGFKYTQVKRGKRTCIYAQEVTKSVTYYEVFIIKLYPLRKVGGNILVAKERFPCNEDFGYWSWSYGDYNQALKKYHYLEKGPYRGPRNTLLQQIHFA